MDTCVSHLADRQEPGNRSGAVERGPDAAAGEVRGRRHGDGFGHRVDAGRATARHDRREPVDNRWPERRGVEEDVVIDAAGGLLACRIAIAVATTSRGARSPEGCTPLITGSPARVDERRALTTNGLGDEQLLPSGLRLPEGRGVELHELDIGYRRHRTARPAPARHRLTPEGWS